jgi:hypothetical protein
MDETGDAPLISDTLTAVLSRRPVMTNDMAEKLDIMMSICFEHFYSLCHSNGKKQKFKLGGGGVKIDFSLQMYWFWTWLLLYLNRCSRYSICH